MKDGPPPPADGQDRPHNIEAEQAVLGAILLNNGAIERVPGLEEQHFYDAVHARIYRTARKMILRGKTASPVSLKGVMALDEGLKALGGPEYLGRLAASVISIAALPDYAAMLRDLWVRRSYLEAIDKARDVFQAQDPDTPLEDTAAALEAEIARVGLADGKSALVHSFADAAVAAANWTNEAYQRSGVPRMSWGLKRLDEITGGLMPGRAYLLGGRTSMGKTTVALATAFSVLRRPAEGQRGVGVLFASLEMPKEELAHRAAAMHLAKHGKTVSYQSLATGNISEGDFRLALEAWADMESLPLLTVEDECRPLQKLIASIRRAVSTLDRQGSDLGLIVVDYLQLIKVPGSKSRAEEVSEAAREMKSLAKQFHVPLIVLAQVKREVEDRKDKHPTLSDIRWAGEAEEAADAVIFVYRPAYYAARDAAAEADPEKRSALAADAHRQKDDLELIVEKNRGGPLGKATVYLDLGRNLLADSEPDRTQQSAMEGF